MNKFYVDENFRQKIVDRLKEKGLGVQTSHNTNNDGISDSEQLGYAALL
ncbi:MAG: DUF5615 family PIN-like protein [Alphaproteobacteria bacterium]